tara:strand:- start:79 stop:1140 length:1062 start_codon:yes stop_codon:yes gene_type:complete
LILKEKLKVGIIGLGIGESHIDGYLSHPACEIKYLCDFDDLTLRKAKEKYPNYKLTKNADDILNNSSLDVISIASYDNFHYEQIIKGISNDKHLFVEKPICYHENEAKKIYEILKSKPHLKFSSNLILRKYERFIDLKKRINANDLGNLSFISGGYNYGRLKKITAGWRSKMDFYSGVVSGGIHIIDLMLWLTNDRVTEVFAYGNNIQSQNTDFKFNDMIVAVIKFSSGMIGNLTVNLGCVHPHFHPFEVYGTKASFINDFNYAKFYNDRDNKNINENRLKNPEIPEYNGLAKLSTNYSVENKGMHLNQFINSILSGEEPAVNLNEIFDALSISFAIEKSINQSTAVQVNYFS